MTAAERVKKTNSNLSREMSETEKYLEQVSDLDSEVSDLNAESEDAVEPEMGGMADTASEGSVTSESEGLAEPDSEGFSEPEETETAESASEQSVESESDQDFPTADQLERELEHEQYRKKYLRTLRGTIFTLITVSAVAVLIAMLFLPVLQIYGTSMTPTLYAGDTVISLKTASFETGDVVAFYLTSNRVLVKRVIATSGQWVDIDENGYVYVDGELLDEPYVDDLAYGECDIDLPYQVPDGQIFVMGDHRSTSVDSRSTSVGCVTEDQIVGKVVFRVWPFSSFGFIN